MCATRVGKRQGAHCFHVFESCASGDIRSIVK